MSKCSLFSVDTVPVSHGWIPHVGDERDELPELLNLVFREIYYFPFLVLQSETKTKTTTTVCAVLDSQSAHLVILAGSCVHKISGESVLVYPLS